MQKNTEETNWDIKKNLLRLFAGLAIAVLITVATFLIFAAMLYFGNIREKWIVPVVTVMALLSVFFGARFAAKHLLKHRFWQGVLLGVLYYLIVYIGALSCFETFNFSVRTAVFFLIGALVGGLGSMSVQHGAAKKTKKRKKKR